jgi:hypothetical protein
MALVICPGLRQNGWGSHRTPSRFTRFLPAIGFVLPEAIVLGGQPNGGRDVFDPSGRESERGPQVEYVVDLLCIEFWLGELDAGRHLPFMNKLSAKVVVKDVLQGRVFALKRKGNAVLRPVRNDAHFVVDEVLERLVVVPNAPRISLPRRGCGRNQHENEGTFASASVR